MARATFPEKKIGQKVIVVNKPGAGGIKAVGLVPQPVEPSAQRKENIMFLVLSAYG